MKNTSRLLTALSAFGMLVITGATAQAGPGGGAMLLPFAKMDADGDGYLTRDEVRKAREARFAKYDANGDGKAEVSEIDAAIMKRLEKRKVKIRYRILGRLDANGDGVIDKEEYLNARMRMFDRADRNGDGRIDRREAAMFARKMRAMAMGGRSKMKKMYHGGKSGSAHGGYKGYKNHEGYMGKDCEKRRPSRRWAD